MTQPTEVPKVAVAGLRIPAPLVPRIIAALRANYPGITEGLDDEAVVRAVLKWIIQSTLVTHEGRQAEEGVEEEVARLREDRTARSKAAREKAVQAAALIEEAPSGAAEPNVPELPAEDPA